ncbi:MAG: ISAs1 family transposase [Planctomycetota bacterium]
MPASTLDLVERFSSVEDPRVNRTKRHELIDVLFICVAGTIAGCDGPSDIASFATTQLAWCRKFVRLNNGVPSHDTIGRVIALIKPEQFQKAFLDWVAALAAGDKSEGPDFVPIDGKTLRGSGGAKHCDNPLHVVSAWATKQGMTLGQVAVDSKSNEITAIPKLLEMLELKGAIVSIDAMGCQKAIAKQIIEADGDYVLALKDNHPTLCQAVSDFFGDRLEDEDFQEYGCRQVEKVEKARGRVETRIYMVAPIPAPLRSVTREWKGIKSIGQAITISRAKDGTETSDVRYYLNSIPAKVNLFADAVRGHWGIESMHWVLDVVFNEDASRLRNGDSTQNFGFLRKFVISLLKRDTSKGSLKGKRKKAGWSTAFLEKLLFG